MALYEFGASATHAQFLLVDGTSIDIALGALTPEITLRLVQHGLKQKIVDAAAIPRNTVTGKSATDAEKIAAMKAVAERIMSGYWAAPSGEGASPKGGYLFMALLVLYPAKTPAELTAYLAKKTPAEQTALRNNPKIAALIAGMKAQKAAATVDTDALLGELA